MAGTAISASHNANYNLFSNIQDYFYWSGIEDSPGSAYAWDFDFSNGDQDLRGKGGPNDFSAWAVRPGDVAAVPEPATALLFGAGAMGIGLSRRYRRRRR